MSFGYITSDHTPLETISILMLMKVYFMRMRLYILVRHFIARLVRFFLAVIT